MREFVENRVSKRITAKTLAITGITAALYFVLTVLIAPLSYGSIQFRFSEIMVLLTYINPKFGLGLIIGCIVSNFFSPLGIIDVIFGTMGTVCTVLAISKTKNLFIASLWPTVFCIFVGIELYLVSSLPLIPTTISVMIGEFTIVTLIGYPIFKYLIKNDKLINILR